MACHEKKVFSTSKAPAAIGPYSVGTGGGPFVFTAGQIGLDPKTGELIFGGIEAQTRQVLTNIKAILDDSGSCMDNVVKTTVYLMDMNDFAKMNAIYAEFFTSEFPVRTTVQVAGLPKNALIEIDAISMVCRDVDC